MLLFWNQPFLLFSKTEKKKSKPKLPHPKRNYPRVLLCPTFKGGLANHLAVNRRSPPTATESAQTKFPPTRGLQQRVCPPMRRLLSLLLKLWPEAGRRSSRSGHRYCRNVINKQTARVHRGGSTSLECLGQRRGVLQKTKGANVSFRPGPTPRKPVACTRQKHRQVSDVLALGLAPREAHVHLSDASSRLGRQPSPGLSQPPRLAEGLEPLPRRRYRHVPNKEAGIGQGMSKIPPGPSSAPFRRILLGWAGTTGSVGRFSEAMAGPTFSKAAAPAAVNRADVAQLREIQRDRHSRLYENPPVAPSCPWPSPAQVQTAPAIKWTRTEKLWHRSQGSGDRGSWKGVGLNFHSREGRPGLAKH